MAKAKDKDKEKESKDIVDFYIDKYKNTNDDQLKEHYRKAIEHYSKKFNIKVKLE